MSNTMSGKEGRKAKVFLEAGMAHVGGRVLGAREYGLRNAGKGFLFLIFTLGTGTATEEILLFLLLD